MQQRILKYIKFFLVFIFVVSSVFISTTLSDSSTKKTITVGLYNLSENNYINQYNERVGYGFEALEEIATYKPWKYNYIDSTWNDCLKMLEEGKIDLLDSVIYTPETAAKFDYSKYSLGEAYRIIVTQVNNDRLRTNDSSRLNNIRIGYTPLDASYEALDKIMKEKNFYAQKISYPSYEELEDALAKNNVDAILTTSTRLRTSQKILLEFDSLPLYYIVKKGNTELLNEINSAMEQAWNYDHFLFHKKYNDYYKELRKTQSDIYLTKNELDYIQDNTVRVVSVINTSPICYFENNQFHGIVPEILTLVREKTGLNFEYIYTQNADNAIELLNTGKADMICDFEHNYNLAEKNNIMLSKPYLNIQYTAILNNNNKKEGNSILAVTKNSHTKNIDFEKKYEERNKLYFDTYLECIKAVDSGKADITYINTYIADRMLKNYNFINVSPVCVQNSNTQLCFGIGKNTNYSLYSTIDKALNSIPQTDFDNIINKHTLFQNENITFFKYLSKNPVKFLGYFLLVIVIILLLFLYIMRVKHKYTTMLSDLAYIDDLTGFGNLNKLRVDGKKLLHKNNFLFNKNKFVFLTTDIFKFRTINENYGHGMGNEILKYIASKLEVIMSEWNGIFARIAGHFIMMFPYETEDDIFSVINKIREQIRFYEKKGVSIRLGYRWNVYFITEKDSDNIEKIIDKIELAREESKDGICEKVVIFDNKMEQKIYKAREIEGNVLNALKNEEFVVYYQPKYNMETKKVIGAEALVRWISKDRGLISPGEFITILEKDGLITELDFYVLENVFIFLKKLLDKNQAVVPISVNQSRAHFNNPHYIERLKKLVDTYKVPTKYIELELTESIFMDIDLALDTINKLKAMGFSISVDDFGSGYSSLNMLKVIPFDTLKIDKEFLNEEGVSEKTNEKIIKKVVEMTKELNMNVICEGVEREEQAEFLKSVGCTSAQGFLYSKPISEHEFLDIITKKENINYVED